MRQQKGPVGDCLSSASSHWFSSKKGLALWEIEQSVLAEIVEDANVDVILQMGPCVSSQNLSKSLAHRACWDIDIQDGAINLWRSDRLSVLPLVDNCVDLIVLRHCLNKANDCAELVAECERVLNPGGQLLISGLNSMGWARSVSLRKYELPSCTTAKVRQLAAACGLDWIQNTSIGIGSVDNRFALRRMPDLVGNVFVCRLLKRPAGGQVRRLFFNHPECARGVVPSPGAYRKTGT